VNRRIGRPEREVLASCSEFGLWPGHAELEITLLPSGSRTTSDPACRPQPTGSDSEHRRICGRTRPCRTSEPETMPELRSPDRSKRASRAAVSRARPTVAARQWPHWEKESRKRVEPEPDLTDAVSAAETLRSSRDCWLLASRLQYREYSEGF